MNLLKFITLYLIILISLDVHEYAHALVAFKQGDRTAKDAGRLTLNPIKHIDPFGSILLPIALYFLIGFPIGYAKPIPINPQLLRNKRIGNILTSLAGPLSNLLLALLFGALLFLGLPKVKFLILFINMNLFLAVLNILPIPPLDGFFVLEALIPNKQLTDKIGPYFLLAIIILFFVKPRIVATIIDSLINPFLRLLGIPNILNTL